MDLPMRLFVLVAGLACRRQGWNPPPGPGLCGHRQRVSPSQRLEYKQLYSRLRFDPTT